MHSWRQWKSSRRSHVAVNARSEHTFATCHYLISAQLQEGRAETTTESQGNSTDSVRLTHWIPVWSPMEVLCSHFEAFSKVLIFFC